MEGRGECRLREAEVMQLGRDRAEPGSARQPAVNYLLEKFG
jgi:hypothetical protein